jgi:hypothetical protein
MFCTLTETRLLVRPETGMFILTPPGSLSGTSAGTFVALKVETAGGHDGDGEGVGVDVGDGVGLGRGVPPGQVGT